jgi:uncharacterized protein
MAMETANGPPKRVAITGCTGLIGSALAASLRDDGHTVIPITRNPAKVPGEAIRWNPRAGELQAASLEGVDVLVHLASENIGSGLWTKRKKAAIYDSRIQGTRLLAKTLCALKSGPSVWVSSSAVGYYGSRSASTLTEDAPPADDFLARLCVDWETATQPAIDAGIRVAIPRTGIVVTAQGGPVAKMLPVFKLGLGGALGDGTQYMSWIALEDIVRVFRFLMDTPEAAGPFNAVAPQAITNQEFTKALGAALHRPTILPIPAFVLRTLLGEMGDLLLLASTRAVPERLQAAGFSFSHPELPPVLAAFK